MLPLAACDVDLGGLERFTRDFHYSYPLKSDGRLSVESFNGSVEISGWDQDTVDISGTKYGPSQDAADSLKVSIDNSADAVSIRVARPSDWRGNLGARFVIKVPRGAQLDRITTSNGAIRTEDGSGPAKLRTSNGSIRVLDLHGGLDAQTSNSAIELTGIEGDVTAHTTNGHIRTDRVNGSLDATTTNGGVNLQITRPDRPVRVETSNSGVDLALPAGYSRDIRVSTSNGGITLHAPHDINARLVARTSNSSIISDFDVRVQGELGKNRMDGVIGSGGPMIDLSTSNGRIRLLRM
ncbi:MAG: hypothetical protein LAP87_10365 [Acidobacteriia bacterium]|nr:hypothetical protein [Terriglobia bacterium]